MSRQDDHTLTEHWNGSTWIVVPSPGVGLLDGVAGSSADDVWSVGFREADNGSKPIQNLIEHWNGKSWQLVPSPEPGAYANGTASISAVTPSDVWAVGQAYLTENHYEPTAEHWNGTDWTSTFLPGEGVDSSLADISSVGRDDIWAAGSYEVLSPQVGEETFTLTEHWNGEHWSIVSSPSPGGDSLLKGVAVVSARMYGPSVAAPVSMEASSCIGTARSGRRSPRVPSPTPPLFSSASRLRPRTMCGPRVW